MWKLGGRYSGLCGHPRTSVTRGEAFFAPCALWRAQGGGCQGVSGPAVRKALPAGCFNWRSGVRGRGRDLARTWSHGTTFSGGEAGGAGYLGRGRWGLLSWPCSLVLAPPLHIGSGRPWALRYSLSSFHLLCCSSYFFTQLGFSGHDVFLSLPIFSNLLVSEPTPCLCRAS